ncbi:reverse transcriptase domain-containing protein [Tanacetum coccineum]|uniref:Reverse transcriptase domain-containing protein n=1 Tax=Tanacetum coccineum TaxID=301880 RepID=A0ABQ5AD05_9ASTR
MVTEGIVPGHKVSSAGLEVNQAKFDVIAKLLPPTNVKAVRSFLRHAGFYRRFIKDFSKISRSMTKLLEKDSVFDFNEECMKAIETLKEKLTNAPIMVSPDWSQPFELMCDARDFVVGAVLGQWEGKHFCPIHFVSKTLNNSQQNYTVTEKELLVVIKNKKGVENVTTNHLSRLENPNLTELRDEDIDDNFPDETLMNEVHTLVQNCDACQRSGSLSRRPFPNSHKFEYILVDIDYVSKWAEVEALPTNDARVIINFLKNLFSYFVIPEALISDRVKDNPSVWSRKFDDALWAFRTAYKTLIGTTPKLRIWKEFKAGDNVLLHNSKYKFKAPKLRSEWYGPFMVIHGFPSGYVDLYDKHGGSFIVNGHRVKLCHDKEQLNELASEEVNFRCEKEPITKFSLGK